jgi:putative tricarboxylic transport membrane protein
MGAADRAASILLFLFAFFIASEARKLPYWTGTAPGPGFLPFWLGVLLAAAAALLFARTFAATRPRVPSGLPDRHSAMRLVTVVGLSAAAAALSLVIGLVLAIGVFMVATLAYLRPGRARANWMIALLTPVAVWLLFVRWLAVPLPAGPFGF